MVKYFESIPETMIDWALDQPLFFVASAPLTGKHVNVSPKGMPGSTFTITSPNSAMYMDNTGSGSETIAHLYENQRITIMFLSFDNTPRILRFWCWGTVVERDAPGFEGLIARMGHADKRAVPSARAVIQLDIWKVGTSCGFGVPILRVEPEAAGQVAGGEDEEKVVYTRARDFLKDRETMAHWAESMNSKGKIEPYQRDNNAWSLDGCTGLMTARRAQGQWLLMRDALVWMRRILIGEWQAVMVGVLFGILFMTTAKALGLAALR